MKIFKIFLLLIILIQISSLESFGVDSEVKIGENNITKFNANASEQIKIKLPVNNSDYYITILALEKGVKITINNVSVFKTMNNPEQIENIVTKHIKLTEELGDNERYIEFNVSKNCEIEISGVLKNQYNEYKSIKYEIDSEIKVDKNNFVIFLGDEKVEKFDMKFNFKENIKNKKATYGFLYLPTKNTEYIVLGKHYREYYEKNNAENKLDSYEFKETAKQFKKINPFYEKEKPPNKEHLAFIFSIDSENQMIDNYSFTINSEIINVFLIVSIVIALVFAVITFFLIRRKQTTEGTNIEGEGNYYKKDKEEKEEKDEKEEATEN